MEKFLIRGYIKVSKNTKNTFYVETLQSTIEMLIKLFNDIIFIYYRRLTVRNRYIDGT